MSYTLHVPATPEQIRALAAIIAREVPDRTRRIKLRFGTCTMLPPTTAEEAQFPGTVSAAYALKMLGEAAQEREAEAAQEREAVREEIQLMSTLVSNMGQEQSNLQMFVDTLRAHSGNFIKPDVFTYSIEQIQENLDRLSACVRDLPVLPWVPGTVSPTTATPPPPPRRRAATVPPTYLAAAATNLPSLL